MGERDPLRTLGLGPGATADDIRAARRRLAKRLHPDRGGDERRMQELNAAAVDALADLVPPQPGSRSPAGSRRPEPPTRHQPPPSTRRAPPPPPGSWRLVEDIPSFVIEGLPEPSFDLLHAVAPSLGEVLDVDPPYVLDVQVREPLRCWCRLELLPEGVTSSINLYVGPAGGFPPDAGGRQVPDIDDVRDAWIAALNEAEWPLPS